MASFILGRICNVYLALHQGTISALTQFSPSTGDWDNIVMNDLLLLVVRSGITRRVLKTTDLNEEDKDTEGQHHDQDLKQYKDKDVEQPNDGSCT